MIYQRSVWHELNLSGGVSSAWTWERVGGSQSGLWRIRVEGGWIYAIRMTLDGANVQHAIFVPCDIPYSCPRSTRCG